MNHAVMPNSARKVQLSDSRLLMERAVLSSKTIQICVFHICGFVSSAKLLRPLKHEESEFSVFSPGVVACG